jgi:hypothetical protein
MKRLLLLDNNVLVHLAEELYDTDEFSFRKVFAELALEYRECWIPGTVREEFLKTIHENKRARRLKILEEMNFISIKPCPVPVAMHEIRMLIKSRDKDIGEAEAILQMAKAREHEYYGYHQFVFCSRDKWALQLAKSMQLEVLPYDLLKERMEEVGIAIP